MIVFKNLEMQTKQSISEEERLKTEKQDIIFLGLTTEDNMLSQKIINAKKMAEKR